MQWYPLTGRDASLLLGVFILSGLYTLIQPFFVPAAARPYAYNAVVFILLLLFFCMVGPDRPMDLGMFLAVLLGGIAGVIILFRDILIRQAFSPALLIFFGGTVLCPLVAAGVYHLFQKFLLRR